MPRLNVGILVFDDVEVLDFCGPFEVFSVTRLDEMQRDTAPSPFNVFTVAERDGIIRARGGLEVKPTYTFATCPSLDILVVPGGMGTRREVDNPRLLDWLSTQSKSAPLMTSVCTGAFLLAKVGLLNTRRATTHWASIDRLKQTFPGVKVLDDLRVVDEGNIVTSAGISAGIDMALQLVKRYFGPEVARHTARRMEYLGQWEDALLPA